MTRAVSWTTFLAATLVAFGCGGDGGGTDPDADVGDTADTAADVPADTPMDTPTDTPTDTPADVPADTPTDGTGDTGDGGPTVCGPIPDGECGADEVCDIRSCGDGATGVCVPRPGGCDTVWEPVCGCDGVTYGNDCERLVAGAALDHDGACVAEACGGTTGYVCPDGEACDVHGCDPETDGTCVVLPADCPDAWTPVCGCDGRTYANDCDRLQAGTALDHDGPCSSGTTCSVATRCEFGQICDIHGCDTGATGTCVAVPFDCPDAWVPVCGCDGRTFANDCQRIRARVALDHEGACAGTTECGGIAGTPCDTGETCDIRTCMDDALGLCVPTPEDCPAVYAPVCGCDGVTYGNDCERVAAGAALDHDGRCPDATCIPECRTLPGGRTEWVDPCTERTICRADCADCTAGCDAIGTRSEGWYASCTDPTLDAGCGVRENLIQWYDCG